MDGWLYVSMSLFQCSLLSIYRGPLLHDSAYNTAMANVEYRSDIELTIGTHSSPSRASYWVPIVSILGKRPRYIKGACLPRDCLLFVVWYNTLCIQWYFYTIHSCSAVYLLHYTHINKLAERSLQWSLRSVTVSQITGDPIVCSTGYSNQQKGNKAPDYRLFVRGIHRSPLDSPHKGPITWKAFIYICNFLW